MAKDNAPPPLRQVFLHLILFRVFIPLIVVGITAIIGVGYLGKQNLLNKQSQIVRSTSHFIENHLDHGGRILDAVARVAETVDTDNLRVFMESAWKAYGYFETMYFLDKNNKITLLMPSEMNYSGLDMSNLPDFQKTKEQKGFSISRPFISIRTGEPTVYLVRALAQGGSVVGELNLGLFQKEIEHIAKNPGKDFVFIMDQRGTLLAHPDPLLVKQQTNLSNLAVFQGVQKEKPDTFYRYDTRMVLGQAVRIDKTGWVVVNQIPLSAFLSSYAWMFVLIFSASLAIWITLAWNLRKQIQRYVIHPLERLSLSANALTVGDFAPVQSMSTIPTSFAELHKLANDFQTMGNNLQARETALQNAHDELEAKVEERTEQLSGINECLKAASNSLLTSNLELQREIVERKRAESQLAQKIVEIERAHEELKHLQSQLIQQEKLASIGQLAAGVAHEINNPIGFINSNLFVLKRYVDELLDLIDAYAGSFPGAPDQVSEQLAHITQLRKEIDFDYLRQDVGTLISESIDGASRVKRIVQDLRDFSRAGSAEWQWTDIHEGLESTLNVLGNELANKAVVVREYGQLPRVECIPSQINQVFMNILINAAHAIPERGKIVIRSGRLAEEVWVSISDDGKGIAPEDMAKIFDPFFTTKPVGEGTGLGLSVSHGIIKKHGGKLEVQSQLGKGTTFTIYLPIHCSLDRNQDSSDLSIE
ncbi:MAG: putative signal transduction histidine kinase [Proteobacteria bacterium]|nr:putative signal transduction histidine kinase [Pseudomonadota bacterium]